MNIEEMQKNEKMFRLIFEKIKDGIILWNDQLRIIDMNSAAKEILSITEESPPFNWLHELFTDQGDEWQKIYKHLQAVNQTGNHAIVTIFENEGIRKFIELSSQHNVMEDLNLTFIRDITEKVEIQEQLRKSDTLNVVGELAAGIAHEIRNPMTALRGFIQLLKEGKREKNPMYYHVIMTELGRIETIVNEFLILAKPKTIMYKEKDVNQIMMETVELLHAQAVLCDVQIQVLYDYTLPKIYCEPNQVKKVFINLIKNAIEVMPDGGKISICLEQNRQNQIHVSIRDEGKGMPQHIINKLGKPFYTTKESGIGLGLMVSFKIIDEHNGSIHIESEIGKGTTFHIYFPPYIRKIPVHQKNV